MLLPAAALRLCDYGAKFAMIADCKLQIDALSQNKRHAGAAQHQDTRQACEFEHTSPHVMSC
jgi:hypothetical protein